MWVPRAEIGYIILQHQLKAGVAIELLQRYEKVRIAILLGWTPEVDSRVDKIIRLRQTLLGGGERGFWRNTDVSKQEQSSDINCIQLERIISGDT